MGWTRTYRSKLAAFSLENLAKYWRYCRLYGLKSATRLAFRRFQVPKGSPPAYNPVPLTTLRIPEDSISTVEKRISVVIPTKNAGNNLEQLLKRLNSQKHVKEVEVVVVDSGSSDGTCSVAEREAATLVRIAPEQFTHSFARNTGAEHATGDYLLFMVQDALPLTKLWLWEMVTALENNQLAAVSCAEYPRSDSDLFYQFLIHTHRASGGAATDRILSWDESCSTYMGLRSNAQLSDVAALIRRDVFEKFLFQRDYAEDLDLGARLIRDGHKLGYLESTRVLHSHNRLCYYFLKRGYVDVRFLVELFSPFLYPTVHDGARLYSDLVAAYRRVARLDRLLAGMQLPLQVGRFVEQLRTALLADAGNDDSADSVPDRDMQRFIQDLLDQGISGPKSANMILPHLIDYLERLGAWASGIYAAVDTDLARDIVHAMHNAYGLYSGTHLAYLYLTSASRGEIGPQLARLDRTLLSGV